MTKQEAIEAMMQGKKVRHRHFSTDEWMTTDPSGNRYTLEDGVRCPAYEFWRWREDESWNDGYSIVPDLTTNAF